MTSLVSTSWVAASLAVTSLVVASLVACVTIMYRVVMAFTASVTLPPAAGMPRFLGC